MGRAWFTSAPRVSQAGPAGCEVDRAGESDTTSVVEDRRRPGRPPRRWRRRLIRAAIGLAVLVVAFFAAGAGYLFSLRGVGDAQARVRRILAAHHAAYAPMPPPRRLGDAAVAAEDEHFYSNFAVNILEGAGRAALATLQTSADPGGSTINQQLAKRLYGEGRSLGAILREIGLGVKLSLNYSKAQILSMYLNAVYYGNGYWGEEAAARGYFGVAPQRLDWAQASMLAGLLQAPSAYDPIHHYRLAKSRQRYVLDQLVANRYLTPSRADAAFRAPLHLR